MILQSALKPPAKPNRMKEKIQEKKSKLREQDLPFPEALLSTPDRVPLLETLEP